MRERRTGDPGATWPLPAIAVALGVGLVLVAVVTHDPATGVTFSASPFSDEGFNAVNARNLALLGRWSTDGWNLYLVNLPFSVVLAGVFEAFGVGIVQARLAAIAMTAATVLLLGVGLRRPFGTWPAAIAALAYGTSTLVLYYGRLVYLEDLVALGLVAGVLTLVAVESRPWLRGILAGLAFSVAIWTKPSAAFAVGGMLAGLVVLEAWRSPSIRRWAVSVVAVVALAGLAWLLLIGIPQRDAVSLDLKIWAPITPPRGIVDGLRRIAHYLERREDDGAILASAPLIVFAGIGTAASVARFRTLRPDQLRLLVAAVGWFAAGMLVVLLASYKPNRYVVPLLPPLAILGAAGVAVIGSALASRLSRSLIAAAGLAVAVALSAPGLAAQARWVGSTGSSLPASQAELAAAVPAGAVTVGADAATLLMSARATTIILRRGIAGNEGDLYSSAGARWVLSQQLATPPPGLSFPPGVWEARSRVTCVTWFARSICLYRLP